MGRRCIFDIEGDGLLYAQGTIKQVTQLWCIGAIDIDTKEEFYWGVDKASSSSLWGSSLEEGVAFLGDCSLLVGHNAIGYDYPCLERLYPWFKRPTKSWDSMVMAKARWPAEALIEGDMKLIHRGKMPPQYMKRHSLKAWGMRTGTYKTDYTGGFNAWNQEMADYLMDDCRATLALWELIQLRAGDWPEQVWVVENGVARIIHEQWEDGVNFDHDRAVRLSANLRNEQARLEKVLVETFGSWWEVGKVHTIPSTRNEKMPEFPDITLPRFGKTGKPLAPYVGPPLNEFQEGHQYTPIKRVTFTPTNRFHLGQRLQDVYGWKPKVFGQNGAAQVDETTLTEIPEAVLPADIRQMILDYFVVTKTYAMVATGRKAWLKLVDPETGRIHGDMDTIGTVTRRATHKNPNLSQVPAVKMEKVKDEHTGISTEHPLIGLSGKFGWECRELFRADDGWEQTGVDASSLELILLGHYLWRFDDGAFSARVCDRERDAHREHSELAGITRADAKTLIYLKVYGGSAWKHSLDLDPLPPEDIPVWLGSKSLPGLLKALERRLGPQFVRDLGDQQKARLAKARDNIIKMEKGVVGLKDLIEDVTGVASKGYLKGMDGSRITVRKSHAGLNSLLQSAGAMVCKQWMILLHQRLEANGLRKGVDWKQTLWSHDEFQFTHRPGLGPVIKKLAEETMVLTGEMLGLRGRFRSDGKTGENWAQCH